MLSGTACPYQSGLSYAPMLEALRPLVATDNPGRARLVDGLVDLGRLFAGLPLPPPTSLSDPSLERTRLFEAVSRLLQRVADRQPVVLLIDDVHWADPSSLDLLLYLARSLAEHPSLIAVTYRSSDIGAALRSALATLRRAGCLVDVPVPRLDSAGVAALAARLLADTPPPPLLDLLDVRAQGTPRCRAMADQLRGHATATAGSAQAPELLADTVATFDRLGMPFDAAVYRLDWAEAAAGDQEAAAVERSVAVLDGLGARPAADRARRLLRRLARRPAPRPRPAGTLSGREAEVARLVAEGLGCRAL